MVDLTVYFHMLNKSKHTYITNYDVALLNANFYNAQLKIKFINQLDSVSSYLCYLNETKIIYLNYKLGLWLKRTINFSVYSSILIAITFSIIRRFMSFEQQTLLVSCLQLVLKINPVSDVGLQTDEATRLNAF